MGRPAGNTWQSLWLLLKATRLRAAVSFVAKGYSTGDLVALVRCLGVDSKELSTARMTC
jgi:hypothetical protein